MNDIEWAVHNLVHSKLGLSKRLCEVIFCSQQILLNKVNPENTTNHLHLSEALALMKHTKNFTLLEAMASDLGFKVVADNTKPVAVFNALLSSVKEHGDVAVSISDALLDKVITGDELRDIVKQINDERRALNTLEASVRAECDG